VHIIREVAATIERPGLLFSGGKDSVVMLHLAVKAFWPAPVPLPVMHVDTGENFDEVIEFRDRTVERHGLRLVVAKVQDDIDAGRVTEDTGPNASRNRLQTVTLLRSRRRRAVGGGRRLPGPSDRGWGVDHRPLDGTREYGMPGRTDWAVHVALWQRGAPAPAITAAAVAQPGAGYRLRLRPLCRRGPRQRRRRPLTSV
jgi:hypothetical protein